MYHDTANDHVSMEPPKRIATSEAGRNELWIGCYTEELPFVKGSGVGIVGYLVDPDSGGLTMFADYTKHLVGSNPSYLCFDGDDIVTVNETEWFDDSNQGSFTFFDSRYKRKRKFPHFPTLGGSPCHLCVFQSPQHETMYAFANYSGGNVSIYKRVNEDEAENVYKIDLDQFSGTGSRGVPERQEGPHAHFVTFERNRLHVCDLGNDTIIHIDPFNNRMDKTILPIGCGPRHLAFHPTLPKVYILTELSCQILVMDVTAEGLFANMQSNTNYSTIPCQRMRNPSVPEPSASAIRIYSNHLFVSNRGGDVDSIVVFKIESDGTLELRDVASLATLTKEDLYVPRDFNICDNWLFVASQNHNRIDRLHFNPVSGRLKYVGLAAICNTPVNLVVHRSMND